MLALITLWGKFQTAYLLMQRICKMPVFVHLGALVFDVVSVVCRFFQKCDGFALNMYVEIWHSTN